MLQGLLKSMETRGRREENSPAADISMIRAVEYPVSPADPRPAKTRAHRRRRMSVEAPRSSSFKYTESSSFDSNSVGVGNSSRRIESGGTQWKTKAPHHEMKRVAYPLSSTYRPPAGDPVWLHALVLDGQIYFPKNLEFCQRVAAAAGVTSKTGRNTHMSPAPVSSPLSPYYDPVSVRYQTKVNENRESAPPSTTRRILPTRAELKRELSLTILREQFRVFVEDMRTNHTEREEYDPTKTYYERPPSMIVEEEYDPERPWYYRMDV